MLPPTCIIACSVFKPALEYLGIEGKYPHVCTTFLPSNLHLQPTELKENLLREIKAAKRRYKRTVCLYGDCFPGIEGFCKNQGTIKVPGLHCFEMLLGGERYQRIIAEVAGTYFLERELIQNFRLYCLEPLELFDEEMRKWFFECYQRVVYVRQPTDPDLVLRASQLAEFLHLTLEIRDADYTYLNRVITGLI